MKKLVALMLALIMVMACTAAMAEPVFQGSALNYEDVPAFVDPVYMRTKLSGSVITVTFGGDVDSATVIWKGYYEQNEELEIVDGVAKFDTAGHKYQPGVSGAELNITWGNSERAAFGWAGDVDTDGMTLAERITAYDPDYFATSNEFDYREVERTLEDGTPSYWDGITVRTDANPTFVISEERDLQTVMGERSQQQDALVLYGIDPITGDVYQVTGYNEARDIIARQLAGEDLYKYMDVYDYRVSGNDPAYDINLNGDRRSEDLPDIATGLKDGEMTIQRSNGQTNTVFDDDATMNIRGQGVTGVAGNVTADGAYSIAHSLCWGLRKVKVYSNDGTWTWGFKVIQYYGLKIDGAAYEVQIGNVTIYYDRAGKWLAETIAVENSDFFGVGEPCTGYVTYKKMQANSNEAYWLYQIEERYAEGGTYEYAVARYKPNAGKTLQYSHFE